MINPSLFATLRWNHVFVEKHNVFFIVAVKAIYIYPCSSWWLTCLIISSVWSPLKWLFEELWCNMLLLIFRFNWLINKWRAFLCHDACTSNIIVIEEIRLVKMVLIWVLIFTLRKCYSVYYGGLRNISNTLNLVLRWRLMRHDFFNCEVEFIWLTLLGINLFLRHKIFTIYNGLRHFKVRPINTRCHSWIWLVVLLPPLIMIPGNVIPDDLVQSEFVL